MQPNAGYPWPPSRRRPAPFSLDLLSEGWTLFVEQAGTWIALMLLLMVVDTVIWFAFGFALPIVGELIASVAAMFFWAGATHAAVKQVRGGVIVVEDLLAGFRRPLDVLIVGVLELAAIVVTVLLCFIPALIFLPMFFFALFLVMDRGLSWRDALTHSYRAVKPYFWSALVFTVIIGLINLLISLVCSCLLIMALPAEILAVAISYTIFYG